MAKTIAEINEKIKNGAAVVVTAEEIIDLVREKGVKKAAQEVDVVTTGTFGPMCSSGVFFNVGHTSPKIKIQKAWFNGVNAYAGLAAVDLYLGATEIPEDDPANKVFPGEFQYGGGHVIEDLVSGKDIRLKAVSSGTDCYPAKELNTLINIKNLNEAILYNPRNAYQNYNVAVNLHAKRSIYTYMGVLRPDLGNASYCSAGQLSPLLNDPYYRTIGIGTRIFLGGGIGYVTGNGTQHNPNVRRTENGVPCAPAGTLSVMGDLKQMDASWLRGTSMIGYGVTLTVGIGVPIPIIDEEMARFTSVRDEDIITQIVDYSRAYPEGKKETLGEVNYKQLKSSSIKINGKDVPTAGISSYSKAKQIAHILKDWITQGRFLLTQPVQSIPSVDAEIVVKPLKTVLPNEGAKR